MAENKWDILGLIKDLTGKKTEKEVEPQTAQQKAQKAFYDIIAQSLTPEKLSTIAEFEPPHSQFDLSKLGDGAVFWVETTQILKAFGMDIPVAKVDYGCITVDPKTQQRKLFVPTDMRQPNKKQLWVDNIYDLNTLEKSNPDDVEVEEIVLENVVLDWDNPLKTFVLAFFQNEIPQGSTLEITVHQVAIVSGGKTVSEKAAAPSGAPSTKLVFAPNPSA